MTANLVRVVSVGECLGCPLMDKETPLRLATRGFALCPLCWCDNHAKEHEVATGFVERLIRKLCDEEDGS